MPDVTTPPSPFSHRFEAFAAKAGINLLTMLPPATASRFAGWLAARIGTLLPVSGVAYKNLGLAMPQLSQVARRQIVAESWANLGATIGELAHMRSMHPTASGPGFDIVGWEEHVAPAIAQSKQIIVLTAHYGNWEVIPAATFSRGLEVGFFYRAANNRLIDQLINKLRGAALGRTVNMFPKGGIGARGAYAYMQRGGSLVFLVDQKLDNGIEVPFFGHPAMTAPGMSSFALKFRCPVIPMRVIRVGPARLSLICEAPVSLPDTGDKEEDIRLLTVTMNQTLERWITERPGAWLWLHRRWPKPLYKK